jgi:hypothetical protein
LAQTTRIRLTAVPMVCLRKPESERLRLRGTGCVDVNFVEIVEAAWNECGDDPDTDE